MADETTQGVHPFTVAWWNRLPTVYRRADRVQGYRLTDAWHGLNRDPRFFTGWDSWHRANTSTGPWRSSVSFTRTFQATPNRPLHIRTWHRPSAVLEDGSVVEHLAGTKVRHVVVNYTGATIADHTAAAGANAAGETVIVDGGGVVVGDEDVYEGGTVEVVGDPYDDPDPGQLIGGFLVHHTVITPDRFGTVHVGVHVAVDVPDARDHLAAVHVGHTDTTFEDLPDLDYYTAAAAYPLLRFMDGVGHQVGFLSDEVNAMHAGSWTDPVTAPESSLPFLASVFGIPQRYSNTLTPAQLRQYLVDLMEGRSPTPGSREHIAITARMWLTGTRDVSVQPAHTLPELAVEDPVHTLVVTARANEVPGNDLAAFERFLNDSGVIPAGHRVLVREGTTTWDAWEAASGETWDTQAQVIRTWNDSESAGLDLSGEGA